MPLVADFSDVVQAFSNADLDPVTLERWVPGVVRKGTAIRDGATNRYVDVGVLDPCFIVPAGGEYGQTLPAGERAREQVVAYTTTLLRADRNPAGQTDVIRRADGRRYRVTRCRPWGLSGAFYESVADLIDE